jgi:spectinomycin phosphotransferase
MLEKPTIPDELISSCTQAEYGLDVNKVSFLPLGCDINTAVYRVDDRIGATYFLKLRSRKFDPITVLVPHLLYSQGIHTVIAPIETKSGQLFSRFEDFTIILYPFIPGKDGYQVPLTSENWLELGWTLKKVHSARVPLSLASSIPCEVFDPQWRESVKYFLVQIEERTYHDPVAERLSVFMKSKRQDISWMVERAEELADDLRQQPMNLVLCHSDAHPGNFLIADRGELYLVDWDNPIFAPRERDLMFFGSGMVGDQPGGLEEISFYRGYGQVEVNQSALAYYRYERIIQDIAEFCKQLLSTTEGGEDREMGFEYFTGSFLPGHVVEVAFLTDKLVNHPS